MIQIVNVSDARNNFAKLIQSIKTSKKPVVIVQDSKPSVVIYPYEDMVKKEEEKEQAFQMKFQKVFQEGEKIWKAYRKKNNLPASITEEEAYQKIKHA